MQIVRFDANANVRWQLHRGRKNWVAVCDPLSLTVEGETFEELSHLIAHSMDVLFRDLLQTGELEHFLRSQGWTLSRPLPISRETSNDRVRFDVPFHLDEPSRHAHC